MTSPIPPFRWAVLGPGRIAQTFAQGLKSLKDAELYAVGSRSPERAQAFAETYGAQTVYTDYATMLADPEVDAVYIATPHRYHFEQIIQCLEAGKSVLCEKPLTVNATQAKTVAKLAQERGLFLMEALWTRYLPIYGVVREWLDAGRIGELRLVDSTMGFAFPRDAENRWYGHDLAGGALLDLGVYNISCSQWAFDRNPKNFQAQVHLGPTRVDERSSALLDFGDGRLAQFSCMIDAHPANRMVLSGTLGSIEIEANFWGAEAAILRVKDEEPVREVRPLGAGGFEYETAAAMTAMRAGLLEEPSMPLAATIANMELMDAIRATAGFRYDFE